MSLNRARVLEFPLAKGGKLKEAPRDLRLSPTYSIEEAAGYLGIPISTLYRWVVGTSNKRGDGPVLQSVDRHINRLSFYDLVEAHILRAAVEKHVPLQQLRRGLRFLRESHPENPRPLLAYNFKTEGKCLLVGGMLGTKDKDREALVNASAYGQMEITGVLTAHLQDLLSSFDEYFNLVGRDRNKMPDTIFPKGGHKVVSITSGVYSGRPVIEGTRIPTAVIAQRYHAGENVKVLAKDYRISKEKIEAAIQYEDAA